MLLNPLLPIHLQSGSNSPNARTGHVIKAVLTNPRYDSRLQRTVCSQKKCWWRWGKGSRGPQCLHSTSWQRTNPCLGSKAVIPPPSLSALLAFPRPAAGLQPRGNTASVAASVCVTPLLSRHLTQLQPHVQKHSRPRLRLCGKGSCTAVLSSASWGLLGI